MKKIMILSSLFLTGLTINAQQTSPANDQNPNYKISQQKYEAAQEKGTPDMNTTVQETYKAFDWTQFKQEKKQDRISRRQERTLARINNRCFIPSRFYYTPDWYFPRP